MTEEHLKIASLTDKQVSRLRELEEELGAHIMALESTIKLKALSAEELEAVTAAEEELGVVLIVYQPQ